MPQRAQVTWRGQKATATARVGAAAGLRTATEHWLTESRAEVPIEEGTLERSGVATVDDRTLTGAVSFDTEYAVPQHERLDYRHDEGRKAKYVEDPGNRESGAMRDLIAAQIRRTLR